VVGLSDRSEGGYPLGIPPRLISVARRFPVSKQPRGGWTSVFSAALNSRRGITLGGSVRLQLWQARTQAASQLALLADPGCGMPGSLIIQSRFAFMSQGVHVVCGSLTQLNPLTVRWASRAEGPVLSPRGGGKCRGGCT
jgi:hypothetical protein